jgi:hypothetical protein
VILSAGSKYFYSNLLESIGEKPRELKMKDNKVLFEIPPKIESKMSSLDDDSVIPIILKYLYGNQDFSKISNELFSNNIFHILSLSHSFGILNLTSKIVERIIETILNEENCVRILYEAMRVNFF